METWTLARIWTVFSDFKSPERPALWIHASRTAEMPDFYLDGVLDIISKGGVKGIAHITGGGFTNNIPRVFPKGLGAVIYENSWDVPTVFKWIQEVGKIKDGEMRRTFNMGIGMVLIVTEEAARRIVDDGQIKAYRIGKVVPTEGVFFS